MPLNVLIITDDPSSPSFRSIRLLRDEIKMINQTNVDLLTISRWNVQFNGKQQKLAQGIAMGITKAIEQGITRELYDIFVISLSKDHLSIMLSGKKPVLDFIIRNFPKAAVFIFGSSSLFDKIKLEPEQYVLLCPRPGVSKITVDFKNNLLNYIAKNR